MHQGRFCLKLRLVLGLTRVHLTGSIAYGLAPGAKCLLLGNRRVLLILILRAFVLHWLLRVAVFALLRTGQQLLLHRLFWKRTRQAISVLRLALTDLLFVKLFHVTGRHSRCHRHRRLIQVLLRRRYTHISHRLTDDLPDRLQERITEFCRTVNENLRQRQVRRLSYLFNHLYNDEK